MIFPPEGWQEYRQRREAIAALLDPSCYSMHWLDCRILEQSARIFANPEAVIITEVRDYPAGAREIHGLVATGELAAILMLIDQAEEWARAKGVEFAAIASREGWARILHDRGYRPHQIELRKEL